MHKNVLVTGVPKGIGRAVAEKFLNEGYNLFGSFYLDGDKALELKNKYGNGRVVLFGPYDFRKIEDINHFCDDIKSYEFDVVVCNAGMFHTNDDFNNFNLEIFNETMNCNFYAPLILTIRLKNNVRNNGSIVIVSSIDAFSGAFFSIAYSISKAALISLTKCLSVNYGGKNIRVNSVAPGVIDTDMNTQVNMNIAPYFTPIARTGSAEDVARVVYFLASNDACFVSGENIAIDGGYNAVSVLLKSEATPDLSNELERFINIDKNAKS